MAQRLLLGATGIAAALALTIGGALAAFKGQQYASAAKISIVRARAIALQAVPGGSGLRYSFDVKIKGKTREVGVDAKTGKVLENSVEGPDAD